MDDAKRVKENYKISGPRKFIAQRMTDSLKNYPQGTGSTYMPVDNLLLLKDKLKKENSNVSMTSLFVKVVSEALKKHPLINSALINNEDFYIYDSINIGVGIGLDQGIMMVVIKEAQSKNIYEISDELQDMISKLKKKKLSMDRMLGSTFTVSNMGMLGVEQVTPFLNPPETGILAIGETKKQFVVGEDNSPVVSNMSCFSITVNHAAVDGLHGGLFLLTLKDILKNPELYMGL